MAVWVEGKHSFFIGAQAFLLDEDRETASEWAKDFIRPYPDRSWVVGKFVEADRANNNRQLFSMEGLQMSRPTIEHAPMNLNHHQRRVVGTFTAAEMIYPTETSEDFDLNPYIESLGVVWKAYFPDEFQMIKRAHAEGGLAFSMECVPERIQCAGDAGCEREFAYDGTASDTYCEHLRNAESDKYLKNPLFTAGAILIPPVLPGWSRAEVKTLVASHSELADKVYAGVAEEFPSLRPAEWEAMMATLMESATQ